MGALTQSGLKKGYACSNYICNNLTEMKGTEL